MKNGWWFGISTAATVFALAACTQPERISLSYTPTPALAVAALPGAEQVRLDVVSEDKRTEFKDRIGTVEASLKTFVADNDVADFLRGAVERELKEEGFVLAAGGLVVRVELHSFYCDSSFSSAAQVSFTVRVRDSDGRTLYAHYYQGSGKGSYAPLRTAESVKSALEEAVGHALKQVAEDKALQSSLLSAKTGA